MKVDGDLCETFGGFCGKHGDRKLYKLLIKELFGCFLTYFSASPTLCNASFKPSGGQTGNTECARNAYSFQTKKKRPLRAKEAEKGQYKKHVFFCSLCAGQPYDFPGSLLECLGLVSS